MAVTSSASNIACRPKHVTSIAHRTQHPAVELIVCRGYSDSNILRKELKKGGGWVGGEGAQGNNGIERLPPTLWSTRSRGGGSARGMGGCGLVWSGMVWHGLVWFGKATPHLVMAVVVCGVCEGLEKG